MSLNKTARAACSAALALVATPAFAQKFPDITPRPEQGDVKVGSLQRYLVRNNTYMYSGETGNTLVSFGEDGVLVVDPQGGQAAEDLVADIKRLSAQPIRWVIDTSAEPARIAGNKVVSQSGLSLEGGNSRPAGAALTTAGVSLNTSAAKIYAREEVVQQLSKGDSDPAGWPNSTYFVARRDMYLNGEPVVQFNVPEAHARGDNMVFLRSTDVIASGELYIPGHYPQIDLKNGGSIDGLLEGLNHLLDLAVPAINQEGGTLVVPGAGRIVDETDIAEFRDSITIIRDRIKDMIGKRMTLAQIQAAKPTLDYDGQYGVAEGVRFVETVYRSLTAGQAPSRR